MTPQTKKNLRTIGVLAIIIFLFLAFWWAYNRNKATDKNDTKVADTTAVTDSAANNAATYPSGSVVGISITGAELIALYQENAKLKAELEACQGNKPVAKQKAGKIPDDSDKGKQKTDKPEQPKPDNNQKRELHSRQTNPKLATLEYEGDIIGDAGVTFNKDGYLCFYIKESLEKSIGNRTQTTSNLNGPSGAEGKAVGGYIVYTTSIVVMTDMLDNEWKWTAFLGYHTQYNFDMWLFHELIKLDNNNLKNNPEIQPNDSGGYHFVGKINYHSKE